MMSCVLFLCVCSKLEVCLDIYEQISYLLEKDQGDLMTIYGYPSIEELYIFE